MSPRVIIKRRSGNKYAKQQSKEVLKTRPQVRTSTNCKSYQSIQASKYVKSQDIQNASHWELLFHLIHVDMFRDCF